MDFHKVETTSNFRFQNEESSLIQIQDWGSSVFRLRIQSPRWPWGTDSQACLTAEDFPRTASAAQLTAESDGGLHFTWDGKPLLTSPPGKGFGVCGTKWVFNFLYDPQDRFYGMGEKHLGLELSQKRTKFWNTDEFGDFAFPVIEAAQADPSYSSFPVLIIKHQGLWAAVVIDNPHCVFMNTGAGEQIFQKEAAPFVPELFFGARDGSPDLWFLADETPAGLVRKIQTLQGRTPLPPLWALGHHQCRWGYRNREDFVRITAGFEAHRIPNDGLWLDIDYMEGFRVFTVDPQNFQDVKAQLGEFNQRGYRVVPILDPGLRQDDSYKVYAEAKAADLLCRTPEGMDYVGYVWPGYTVFPDFSLPEARAFWQKKVKEFTDMGFGGFWIDMNDPATGSVPHDDMRFNRGTRPHSAYHNQYALGMAEATRNGVQASRPDERPFVISRSAYLSSSRHTAVWTGDNISNPVHMKGAIALSLNLSVSGMPFNGPDVPGFAKDASNELMRAWYKLGFLFPFLRNHKVKGDADQEPWSRDKLTTTVVGDYIRLRYKLLPYLYQQFQAQQDAGDPILRPIWYHDPAPAFDRTDDQFFVGPALVQAPFTDPKLSRRTALLPRHQGGTLWFDVQNKKWTEAGAVSHHRNSEVSTPIFLAAPSALPLQRGIRYDQKNDLGRIDLLIVLGNEGPLSVEYRTDDGLTEAWRNGAFSQFQFLIRHEKDRVLVTTGNPHRGFGGLNIRFQFLTPGRIRSLIVDGKIHQLKPENLRFAGSSLTVAASGEIDL